MPRTKSLLATAFCTFAILGASATAASAGEVNGKGEPIPAPSRANSICVFSGQNDVPNPDPDSGDVGGRTQSFGQENRLGLVDPRQFNPGDACRGGSNFARE